VTAANWSASEFHWPHVEQIGDGLGAKVWGKPGEPDAVSWQMRAGRFHLGISVHSD
jgi:hypothetical protein